MKRGAELASFFPLEMPPARAMVRWFALAVGMMIAYDVIALALGKPIVPEFSRQVWATSSDRATLVAVIVVAAPIFEELLFRGFLLRGLVSSRLGEHGAVAFSALAWALVHLQYDWYGIAYIFLIGLLFGYARLRTGSLAVPIMLHMLVNAVSTAETALIPP
jgi:membrane protease YdiL (CAAX protease family)